MSKKQDTLQFDPLAHLKGQIVEFKPIAYYDKHLDCIRVQLKDCSALEERKNRIFTVLLANHSNPGAVVGCNIKGVRHVFEKVGLEMKGVVALTAVLNAIVKYFPETSVATTAAKIATSLQESELQISFAAA